MLTKNLLNRINLKQITAITFRFFRIATLICGIILIISLILSFTDIPYWQYYWLGTHQCELEKEPDYIVLLGGSGMPSADGLIRTYYAAGAWNQVKSSKIIIAIPPDTNNCFGSPEMQMANELLLRGIDSNMIIFERNGYNTQSQALKIAELFPKNVKDTIALRLITTPEHMYRSVKVFKKMGFKYVGGTPAFEVGLNEKKLKKPEKKDDIGLDFRYNMWSYLKYEITVVREYFAIAYYKIKGWI